jgi:AraC-like DNA-binding protein
MLQGGSEVEYPGEEFIASFDTAAKAISCALSIKDDLSEKDAETAGIRIAINGGEPIEKSNHLFGDVINFAQTLCAISNSSQIALSTNAKSLASHDVLQKKKDRFFTLTQPEEDLAKELFSQLESKYSDPAFDIPEFSHSMAMSQAQLYRKITALSGLSGNHLLKDFRLEKAKDLLRKQRHSISQITFETGFSSPSYFTKCFKEKYGLLPNEYLELVKNA